MKSILTLLSLLVLSGCSGCTTLNPTDILRGASSLTQVPAARQQIIDYLPAESLETVQPDLEYLDRMYNRAVTLIPNAKSDSKFSPPPIGDGSVVDAAKALFGAPEQVRQVERSYANIRKALVDEQEATKRVIPPQLVVFDQDTVNAYSAVKDAIESNDRLVKAIVILDMLKPFAIALL